MLVGPDQRARTWSEMSAAKERRDAAFYAGRDDQAERARTEAARTAALDVSLGCAPRERE